MSLSLITLIKSFSIVKSLAKAIKPILGLGLGLYFGSIFVEYIFKKEIYHKVFNIH